MARLFSRAVFKKAEVIKVVRSEYKPWQKRPLTRAQGAESGEIVLWTWPRHIFLHEFTFFSRPPGVELQKACTFGMVRLVRHSPCTRSRGSRPIPLGAVSGEESHVCCGNSPPSRRKLIADHRHRESTRTPSCSRTRWSDVVSTRRVLTQRASQNPSAVMVVSSQVSFLYPQTLADSRHSILWPRPNTTPACVNAHIFGLRRLQSWP